MELILLKFDNKVATERKKKMAARKIIRDQMILMRKSTDAKPDDKKIAEDLRDTLLANKDKAIGLAANMIGKSKKIIAVFIGPFPVVMLNPKIVKSEGKYLTEEGCLSLDGVRKTARYEKIWVEYEDLSFTKRSAEYDGIAAEAIQHEIDHTKGKII